MWPDDYIICKLFGHLQQWIFAQKQKNPKVGSTFCQIINKHLRKAQRLNFLPKLLNFATSGHTELSIRVSLPTYLGRLKADKMMRPDRTLLLASTTKYF